MKILSKFIIFAAVFLGTNGCATYNVTQEAQGHTQNVEWFTFPTRDYVPKNPPDNKSHPAYYLLIPLTVPVDIVTCPIQFVDYWVVLFGGMGYQ
jgi:hypothetical protein